MMILVADSGSTKTDWVLRDAQGNTKKRFSTMGMNPSVMSEDHLRELFHTELLPEVQMETISEVEFYGAGCTPAKCPVVAHLLMEILPGAHITVDSDMLGAARALCGNKPGIAAILGTGANSCYYDGQRIAENTPALGFILGDEGSGAVLGRLFLNALLKGRMPEEVRLAFADETGLTKKEIIERVYRGEQPNRFLASMSPFIREHIYIKEVRALVVENFRSFFHNNIRPYNRPELPVNFVGSMAYHYEAELREAAELEGFKVGKILKAPL